MQIKSTNSALIPQQVIAGINPRNSEDVEFFGIIKTQTVFYFQTAKLHSFEELSPKNYALVMNAFYADQPAVDYFKQFNLPLKRKVELYVYYMYGSLDHTPDIKDGKLQPSENFRESEFCPSLQFAGKNFTIDGVSLSLRELTIIDMSARECTDYEIACALHICQSTLDWHKRNLFTKTNTQTKLGVVMKAYSNQIIH